MKNFIKKPYDSQDLKMNILDVLTKISTLSERIGKNLHLVQGGGGNTSVKESGRMWVKASGKWLADARRENIFVSVDDVAIRGAIKRGENDPVTQYIDENQTLRPSIETTLHALLPHKVVLHVHSVNVIAWAVRVDGRQQLNDKLQGLDWVWIDYHKPGISLTSAIAKAINKHTNVLILANHGLVVSANSCDEAEKLLFEVEKKLTTNILNTSPKANYATLKLLTKNSPYTVPDLEDLHAIATNLKKLSIANKGVFYPDHVVFLGGEMAIVDNKMRTDKAISNYQKKYNEMPSVLYIKGIGVLLKNDITSGAKAMLFALAYVLERIDLSKNYQYLTHSDIAELLDWDAEKYRQTINKI